MALNGINSGVGTTGAMEAGTMHSEISIKNEGRPSTHSSSVTYVPNE